MSTARIYWYPDPDGYLEETDLGRRWSEHVAGQSADLAMSRTGEGGRVITTFGSWRRARFAMEYIDDADLVHDLYAVVDHLRRNNTIAIAEEGAATWGGFATRTLQRGDNEVKIAENLWSEWSPPMIAAGDEIVIRGGSAGAKWETCKILSIGANQKKVTLDRALRYSYEDQPWVLVHDRRFWPFLRFTDQALTSNPLQTDHRITWDLDLELEEDPAAMAALAAAPMVYAGTSTFGYRPELDLGELGELTKL